MILTREHKNQLRMIHMFRSFQKEKDGIPIDSEGKKVIIPGLEEIRNIAKSQIFDENFSVIIPATLQDCNCIIRCYRWEHIQFQFEGIEDVFNGYGFNLYTKKKENGVFKTYKAGKKEKFDQYIHTVRFEATNGMNIEASTEYKDFPIKIQ